MDWLDWLLDAKTLFLYLFTFLCFPRFKVTPFSCITEMDNIHYYRGGESVESRIISNWLPHLNSADFASQIVPLFLSFFLFLISEWSLCSHLNSGLCLVLKGEKTHMFSVSSLPEHLQKRGLQKKNMREGVRKVLTHIVKKKEKYSVHGKSYDHSICRKIRKNVFFCLLTVFFWQIISWKKKREKKICQRCF